MTEELTFLPWLPQKPRPPIRTREEAWDDTIKGFFNFAPAYDFMMKDCPARATVVEVGVYCGKSLVYLKRLADKLERRISVVGVDWGLGIANEEHQCAPTANEALLNFYIRRLNIPLICCLSHEGARFFQDKSLWMVFIDADHSYEAVRKDIDAWWPKVQPGGYLSGHDYEWGLNPDGTDYCFGFNDFPGVKQAVDETFGPGHGGQPMRSCWMVQK